MKTYSMLHKEYSEIPNNNDKLFKALIDAIEGSKNDDVMEMLVKAVALIAEKQVPDIAIKQDNEATLKALASLNESLAILNQSSKESYNTMARAVSEIKPEINFNPVIENKKDDTTYKFEIKRNSANLITEVVARPL